MDRARTRRDRRWLAGLILATPVLGLVGCGNAPTVNQPAGDPPGFPPPAGELWPGPGVCDLMPGEAMRGADLVLAVGDSVVPRRAPVPATEAERVVFTNLYETLTRVDCTGRLLPGLAVSWRREDGGRRWLVTLREGARFWDGAAITAGVVVESWRRNRALARRLGRPCPGAWLDDAEVTFQSLDSRLLSLEFPEPQPHLPRRLAHPTLAVAAPREGWTWPVGSGPCRLAADTGEPLPDLVCRPHLWSAEQPLWNSFTFRCRPGADARDLLTADVDLAMLRDAAAVSFYAEVPEVRTAPLPWDRLLLVAIPTGATLDVLAAARRAELAVEATVAEARPWSSLFFHGCEEASCPLLLDATVPAGPRPPEQWDAAAAPGAAGTLVCDRGDRDAQFLGERLASFVGGTAWLEALPADRLAARLESGRDAGYVLSVDACYPDACLTLAGLIARAGWLLESAQGFRAPTTACEAADRLAAHGVVVPLAQTRARLVWHGSLSGLALAHDGTPRVAGLGHTRLEAVP